MLFFYLLLMLMMFTFRTERRTLYPDFLKMRTGHAADDGGEHRHPVQRRRSRRRDHLRTSIGTPRPPIQHRGALGLSLLMIPLWAFGNHRVGSRSPVS